MGDLPEDNTNSVTIRERFTKEPMSKKTARLGTPEQAFIQTLPFFVLRSRRVMSKLGNRTWRFCVCTEICVIVEVAHHHLFPITLLDFVSAQSWLRPTDWCCFFLYPPFRLHHRMFDRFVPNAPWILLLSLMSHSVFSSHFSWKSRCEELGVFSSGYRQSDLSYKFVWLHGHPSS